MSSRDEAGQNANMVLRTVYLPKEVDDQLKQIAFERQTSKNDLIRSAVTDALSGMKRGKHADRWDG